jgi:hypothetical protein
MRRLAQDATLRERLGRAGQAWWEREHSVQVMVEDYERVVLEALKVRPALEVEAPKVLGVPEHLRPDGDAKLNALLTRFGIEAPI